MVSMERPKPQVEEVKSTSPEIGDSYYEKYPYGLRLNLNNDDLVKLGIDITNINAGDVGTLNAKIIFTEVSSRQSMDGKGSGKQDDRLEIQITDLEVVNDNDFGQGFKDALNGE